LETKEKDKDKERGGEKQEKYIIMM